MRLKLFFFHPVVAPYGVHSGEAFLAGDVVLALQMALIEDAARQAYAVDYHVAGKALARRRSAQSAVDLR